MDPEFVLLCKWRSRIFFLWNVKKAKKSLRDFLYNQTIYAYFPVDFDALSSPWFPRKALLLKHVAWGWLSKCENFPGWIPYFEASNLRTFAEVFLRKGSLPKFLITVACDCLTLIFFNIIPAIKHMIFCSLISILKVESKMSCRRDGTRIVSRENSFARK